MKHILIAALHTVTARHPIAALTKVIGSVNTYFHGSPEDKNVLEVVERSNALGFDFGGVFLGKEEKLGHIGSSDQHWYQIDIDDKDILTVDDIYHRVEPAMVKKVLQEYELWDLPDDEMDLLWDIMGERHFDREAAEQLPGFGENIEWEIQALQGRIAKALGYKAVKMTDENGTVYFLPGPATLTRVKEDQDTE